MTFAVEKAFGGQKIMLAEVQAKLAAAEKQVSSGKILPAKEALAREALEVNSSMVFIKVGRSVCTVRIRNSHFAQPL